VEMGQRRALSHLFFSWQRRWERDLALMSSSVSSGLLGSARTPGRALWSERRHAQSRPPVAPKQPFLKEAHGVEWNDPYGWMCTPAGRARLTEHLHRENRYADAVMADTLPLQRRLVQEMEGRMSTALATPPERWGSW
jgi:oligopeptidase B